MYAIRSYYVSEPLFSKKNLKLLSDPLNNNNPITVQVLGICSALAVTAQLKPALVMAISVTAVLAFANVIISLLRNTIPNRIRIIVQLVVVAALVITSYSIHYTKLYESGERSTTTQVWRYSLAMAVAGPSRPITVAGASTTPSPLPEPTCP